MHGVDIANIQVCISRKRVVLAMDFDHDLKRLVIVFKCLWILALIIKH